MGAALATSPHSPNAINYSGSDDIFCEASQDEDLFSGELLSSESPDDDGKIMDGTPHQLFEVGQEGALDGHLEDQNEEAASMLPFPLEQFFSQNRFHNAHENKDDEGYDSEGNLPHFADTEGDDLDDYDEATIEPATASVPVQAVELTVVGVALLGVKELKEELRKHGHATTGKKCELADHLKETIQNNIRISAADAGPLHESMNGLDMTARWVLLTRTEVPGARK